MQATGDGTTLQTSGFTPSGGQSAAGTRLSPEEIASLRAHKHEVDRVVREQMAKRKAAKAAAE
jgi:hypothetical protein